MEGKPFSPFRYGFALETKHQTMEEVNRNMAELVSILSGPNDRLPTEVHNLADNVLSDWIQSHKEFSNGKYAFVDWRFAREVLELDK